VGDYASALRDILRGQSGTPAIAVTTAQLNGWLTGAYAAYRGAVPWVHVAHNVNVFALFVTCGVALLWLSGRLAHQADLGVVAVTAICAHIPMLFIFNTSFRYAVVGWDLSLLVMLASMARLPILVHDAGGFLRRRSVVPQLVKR
jgi:hypothetical protein